MHGRNDVRTRVASRKRSRKGATFFFAEIELEVGSLHAASAHHVEDEHHNGDDENDVDKASGDVHGESK